MHGSLRIGTIAGITISVHVSWIIIVVLLTWSLATSWFPFISPNGSVVTGLTTEDPNTVRWMEEKDAVL